MSLDLKIVEAIKSATSEAGQPTALSRRLVAWLEAVAEESEDINDVAATDRRLELIYEAVALGESEALDDEGGDDEEEAD